MYVDDVRTPNAKKTYTVSIYKSSNNTDIGEVIVNGIAAITRKNNPTIYEIAIPSELNGGDSRAENPATITIHTSSGIAEISMKNSETGGYDVAHGELIAKRMLDEPDVSKVNKFEFTIRSSSGSVKQTYTLYVYTDYEDTDVKSVSLNKTELTAGASTDVDISLFSVPDDRIYTAVVNRRNPVDLSIVPTGNMAKVELTGFGIDGILVSDNSHGYVFENLALNSENDTVFNFRIMSYDGKVVSDPYQVIIKYVEDSDVALKSVVFDGVTAEKADFKSNTYLVRADSTVTNGILTITAANEDAVVKLGSDKSTNGVLNVSYNVTKNVSKVDFTVTSKDGKAEQTYTLYIIRSNTGEKEVYVNGTKLTKTSGGYTYEVPYGATAADIKVVADSEVSKVQIGDSEFKVSENTETVTLDSGKTTTVKFKIYSYPYDDNSFIAETITLVRQDQSLALSNVMVQSKSERDYTKLTPDKYGNYKTAIPSTDDSASIVIATRRSDSKLGLIRVTDTGDVVLGEDQGQLSVPDIANLGTVNKFYIVVSDGTKTSRYELVIVKYSNNTSVEKVIAERGTEDEYVAKDASCGGGSTILPEDPDGSKASPYQITTAEELQAMSDHLDAYYVLMNDIDLSGTAWTPDWYNFQTVYR